MERQISDAEITYFHVMTDKRLDGLPAVKALYEKFRGTPLFDGYEIVDPKVQVSDDVAVLAYSFVRHDGAATSRWNATQVYRRKAEGRRVRPAGNSLALVHDPACYRQCTDTVIARGGAS